MSSDRQSQAGRVQALRAVADVLDEAHFVPLLLWALGERDEELADNCEVVRVARALHPHALISLPFEDPRLRDSLHNNITSVDVAKATE